ncbi:MAG: lipoyl protein ligase domain-containing protein [Ilumatobacteraceae bacterium]
MTAVEFFRGASASTYHARELPSDPRPHVWVFDPACPALVLGSTQSESLVDESAARSRGIEVVRRRSGGGMVLLMPGEMIWIDVLVPRRHHLWRVDIGTAPVWLGESLAGTLTRSGRCGEGIHVHTGAMQTSQWSGLVCFAGRGPGEVFAADGSKIVGISQRRTSDWVRFQCIVSLRWNPETLVALLAPPRPEVLDIATFGASISAGGSVDDERLREDLVGELVTVLDVTGEPMLRPR